jgi:L-alanine-DL-glutamate epimerase-like enolase superfamily enzyme
MKITAIPFRLKLNYPFKISDYTRVDTPIVFIKIEQDSYTAWGECSMPPYLGETIESSLEFVNKVDAHILSELSLIDQLSYIDSIALNHNAIKAAFDLALHDLFTKKNNLTLANYFNVDESLMPSTSFTIGIDSLEVIKEKLKDAEPFNRIKVKLGTDDDKQIINVIRSQTNKEIVVDANRGWLNKSHALNMIDWLATKNCLLIEQPMPTDSLEEMIWLKERSSLPLFADESCKRYADIDNIKDGFHGINIKLMKSTGLAEAYKMIKKARELSLEVMIGCMSESSVGILAAASLAPLCDYADIDSVWMVSNNPFETPKLIDGKIKLPTIEGIGYKIINDIK